MDDAIVPDDKDWTWVLERACPDCGFDSDALALAEVPDVVRANAGRWVEVLDGAEVAVRPRPEVWSPLEYACHVRDVYVLFDQRLHLMLDEDDPTFANWDQDVTAAEERYGEQDPAAVSAELARAGEALALSFAAVSADEVARTGRRSDGARFTVTSFARYLVHDPVHHVWDVTGSSAAEQGVTS